MSSSLLSQEELSALREQAPRGTNTQADSVSLASPDRNSRKKLPHLQRHIVGFADALRQLMARELRISLTVDTSPIDLLGPQSAITELQQQAAGIAFGDGHELAGYACINAHLCFQMIELAFGAQLKVDLEPEETHYRQRLTEIERQTVQPLLQSVGREIVKHIFPNYQATTLLPSPIQVELPPNTEALARIQVSFMLAGQKAVIVLFVLGTALGQIDDGHTSAAANKLNLVDHVNRASVHVTALLGKLEMTIPDVAGLRPGDLLWLDGTQSQHVPVLIEGTVKFFGKPVARGGVLGVEIITGVA